MGGILSSEVVDRNQFICEIYINEVKSAVSKLDQGEEITLSHIWCMKNCRKNDYTNLNFLNVEFFTFNCFRFNCFWKKTVRGILIRSGVYPSRSNYYFLLYTIYRDNCNKKN